MRTLAWLFALSLIGVLAGCQGGAQHETEQTSNQEPAAPQEASAGGTAPQHEAEPPPPAASPAPAAPAPARQTSRPQAAQAQAPAPKPSQISVPAGSVLMLATDTELSSKTNHPDDVFTATIVEDVTVGERVAIPAGSVVRGRVTEAVPAKRGAGNARLAIAFDTLELDGGYRTPIVGSFQEVSESKKKRNAAIIGGSAAGGALLGRILGKDTKGAVVGSIIGGGIGTAVVMGQEGEQVTIPAGTPFEIHLDEAVKVPAKAPGA